MEDRGIAFPASEMAVRLNFLPLAEQEFTFSVYRRVCKSPQEPRDDDSLYRNSLPIEPESQRRADYWIAIEPRDGFDHYVCVPTDNHRLTVHYLYEMLAQAASERLSVDEFEP